MTAVNYNVRIDKELRDDAFAVLESYGLQPSQAIRLFLNQVARTGTVPLSFDYAVKPIAYEQNPLTMQAVFDARNGKTSRYNTPDELLNDIDAINNDTLSDNKLSDDTLSNTSSW